MSNKEIAEFCNCDVRDVYFAINNEAQDNLSEDQDYLDGKLGDIVNIDDFVDFQGADDHFGTLQIDSKMEIDMEMVMEDVQMEDVFTAPAQSRVKAYPTPESDVPQHEEITNDGGLESEEEIERDCEYFAQ